jgi:hypothetical protein
MFTIGGNLGNIANGDYLSWTVCTDDDVATVAADIVATFREVGLPYFQHFSSLDALGHACAADDLAALLRCSPTAEVRAKVAVAAAYLLGRQDHLGRIIDEQRRILERHQSGGLADFTVFAAGLQALTNTS